MYEYINLTESQGSIFNYLVERIIQKELWKGPTGYIFRETKIRILVHIYTNQLHID